MTVIVTVPRDLIEKFLQKVLPMVSGTMDRFNAKADHDGLTPNLKHTIEKFQVEGWAEAYDDFVNYFVSLGAVMSTQDEFSAFMGALPTIQTLDELNAFIDEIWKKVDQYLDDDSDDDIAFMDADETEPWALSSEDQPISRQAVFLSMSLVVMFNYFSCMTHRQSLFQLVTQAKEGDDESLLKAVQIDKTCLSHIPYFRERIERAAHQGELRFLKRIAQFKERPVLQSGTELNLLYFVFSALDSIGILEAFAKDNERFAALCQSLRIYGPEPEIEAVDVASFDKTLSRFKQQYQTLRINPNNTITWVVKDTI